WTPWATFGSDTFLSVAGCGNVMYALAKRNGVYWLESFAADDSLTLDSAITLSGAASATWALGAGYASQTVSVVSGNYHIGYFTADGSGNINLVDVTPTSITVGFGYSCKIETLPPSVEMMGQIALGNLQRISVAHVWLDTTLSMSLEGADLIL